MAIEAGAHVGFHHRERVVLKAAREIPPISARRRTQGHDAPRDVDHAAGRAGISVGPEVARVGLVLLTRVLDGGEHVAFRERDERVGLVVLEVGVEERGVLVDQVLLKDERLVLVADDDVLKRVDLVDEQWDLRAVILEVHVLAHAGAQLLRLAHVDDLAVLVLPEVHAGQGRHSIETALDARNLLRLGFFHVVLFHTSKCSKCARWHAPAWLFATHSAFP